ncbi:hypothetical protein RRG08_062330 [Elysia crispata]|uniref:Uncharacterized protein n=1 Tax=Elysia crispata TaxID=231223 RepID=A0AAE1CY36_9GAST|nr:hypothetical protein RRG08_062330 [Elysia crispata]
MKNDTSLSSPEQITRFPLPDQDGSHLYPAVALVPGTPNHLESGSHWSSGLNRKWPTNDQSCDVLEPGS